jgi:hypothetical protein
LVTANEEQLRALARKKGLAMGKGHEKQLQQVMSIKQR